MLKNLKKVVSMLLVVCILFTLASGTSLYAEGANGAKEKVYAKNVIVMIPDGMSTDAAALTRWYKGSSLSLDEIAVGAVRTYAANSIITDSAPAATALATGWKSNAGFVSVRPDKVTVPKTYYLPEDKQYEPLATILEAAKLKGKATGLISTSEVSHATPAAYAAHNADRNDELSIIEQMVYNNVNVVFGAGAQFLQTSEQNPGIAKKLTDSGISSDMFVTDIDTKSGKKKPAMRIDGENLVAELKAMGYAYVTDSKGFKAIDTKKVNKVWGMFAGKAMAYDFDRSPDKEPSLAEMTEKAIEILNNDKDGFFLMVEGSKVDWAAHANDPIGVISDTLAFDNAVKVALDFAKKDKNTLIVAMSDHGNGGISIGNKSTDSSYDTTNLEALVEGLKRAKLTGEGIGNKLEERFKEINIPGEGEEVEKKIYDAKAAIVKDVMKQYYGLKKELTDEQIKAIIETKPSSMNYTVGPIISANESIIGWTTTGHTGEDVTLYAYGPGKPSGVIDNTDVAKVCAKAMGIDIADAQKKLFIRVEDALNQLEGYKAGIDTADMTNPVLIISKGNISVEMPIDKNILIVNGNKQTFNGLTVLSANGSVYIPQEAIDMIKKLK